MRRRRSLVNWRGESMLVSDGACVGDNGGGAEVASDGARVGGSVVGIAVPLISSVSSAGAVPLSLLLAPALLDSVSSGTCDFVFFCLFGAGRVGAIAGGDR